MTDTRFDSTPAGEHPTEISASDHSTGVATGDIPTRNPEGDHPTELATGDRPTGTTASERFRAPILGSPTPVSMAPAADHSPLRTEDDDPLVLDPAEALELLAGAPWRRFAAVGDSLALGVGDPSPGYRPQGWSDRLAALLDAARPGLAYLNTGRIGATIEQVLREQVREVVDFAPDLVHISCGGNDLLLAEDMSAIPARLDAVFAPLARTGARLFVFGIADVWDTERMAPMRPLRPRMEILNAMVAEVAARYDALVVDFWEHPLRTRPEVMSADLIHFATSGHAVVTGEVIRALSAHLAAAGAHAR